MNLFYYLLEANAYLLVFYGFYLILLRKETFYSYNRFYLLGVSLVSFILPGIKLSGLRVPDNQVYHTEVLQEMQGSTTPVTLMLFAYLLVSATFFLRLIMRLLQISSLIRKGSIEQHTGYKMVKLDGNDFSFSFMNYLFINTELPQKETIIRHELIHIRQKHSLDILFFEILQALNWFNPAICWMQTEIKYLHEYIADEETVENERSASDYALFLIHNSYGASNYSLGSQIFSTTLLKQRITMLNQEKSGELAVLKFRLLVFLLPLMLCASGLVFTKPYGFIDLMPYGAEMHTMIPKERPNVLKLPPPVITMRDEKKNGSNTSDKVSTKPESKFLPPVIVAKEQAIIPSGQVSVTLESEDNIIGDDAPPPPPEPPVN